MDKYFIFSDDNLINVLFIFSTSIILTLLIAYLCKKLFKFNCPGYIWFVFIIIRLVIGYKIDKADAAKFIEAPVHSVVIKQVECRAHYYRNFLKDGHVFITIDEVTLGDSISKNANSNTYQKYETDVFGYYIFVKEYNY